MRSEDNYERTVNGLRTILIAILVVAAASPYTESQKPVMKKPEIVVLKDNSRSASILNEPSLKFRNIEIQEKVIASGNQSELKQGILRNLEEDTAYLAISDFQSEENLMSLKEHFQKKNSTLSLLKTETENENSVAIRGPSSTVPGAKNKFQVIVYSSRDDLPKPQVNVDGENVQLNNLGNNKWSFKMKFSEKGSHKIKAKIDSNDRFETNNQYFKTVKVVEKPEVLIVGEKGSLGKKLEKFYKITYTDSLPDSLSKYYSIILKKKPKKGLISYVSKGNGIVYTGDYKKQIDVLPVKSVPKENQNKGAKITLAIDISQGTGKDGTAQRIKKIAYNLVEKLPYNNKVGAIAYNREAYIISKPQVLAQNREDLKNKISRLNPSGPSFHNNGIKGAKRVLNQTGNIILITDGKIGGLGQNYNVGRKTKEVAYNLKVRLITVGVGKDRRKEFLQDIADRGNGFYLDAQQSSRLQFQFKAGGASGKTVPLVVVNPNHFVTQGLKAESSATFFDSVKPRTSAKVLVSGTNGKPFLTTWRYGLGKVAAFSGGDTELSQVGRVDPNLITRTVSWTVGNPKRKQKKWVKIEDSRRPENVHLSASFGMKGLNRQGKKLYTKELEPRNLGFHNYMDQIYAYNYNVEIEKIGYNKKSKNIVRATGGEVYQPDEKREIRKDLKKFSKKQVITKKSLSNYILLLGLIIFLSEVGFRKMNGKR